MNTKNLKAYAPKARSQFIEAIKKRAAQLGIYQDKIADVQFEGGAAIIEGRAFTKKQGEQRKALERKIEEKTLTTHKERYDLFIREMAYTWFNRLAAIRYMELHDYLDHGFRVLSPAPSLTADVQGSTNVAGDRMSGATPEILDHASDVVDTLDPDQKYLDKNHIIELQLAGNKEEELYRELLLGQCHRLYNIMPFMFEAMDDATELLLPDNLTKTDSILKGLVNEIPEEDWREIEVIGWLYQFYISEYKDAVIGKVVKSEDIPAATQIFTPNWIVKYLVQNSLGRQWLATYPESELKGKMEYYIEPAEQTDDVIEQLKAFTPTSIDPEQIKVLDPAAGSGHILVEVYDVLREIYLERGYRLREIPELILTKNIYGLDIDDRAAQLAGFALMMKAREDDRRIFQRVEDGEVALNVFSLQSTEGLDIGTLWQALNLEGKQKQGSTGGLFNGFGDEPASVIPEKSGIFKIYFELLQTLKSAFLQAKTFGSLIKIDNEHLINLVGLKELLEAKKIGTDPSAKRAANDLLPIINQAISTAQKYDVVVANPPYMGNKGMNADLKAFARKQFPNSKSDLFSIYIERCLEYGKKDAQLGLVTPYVWMFIKSYEQLRQKLLNEHTLNSLVQLEYNAFAPACIPVCTFTISKTYFPDYKGGYIRLSEFKGHENQPHRTLEAINNKSCGWFFEAKPDEFKKIPGFPIAYKAKSSARDIFSKYPTLDKSVSVKQGLATTNNDLFIRRWYEVNIGNIGFDLISREEATDSRKRWFPFDKGGTYRKWFGNNEFVVDWEFDGKRIKDSINTKYPYLKGNPSFVAKNAELYFKPGITWGKITSGAFSCRLTKSGNIFSDAGMKVVCESDEIYFYQGMLSSKVFSYLLSCLSETLNYEAGNIGRVPKIPTFIDEQWKEAVGIAEYDWNQYERSSGFIRNPIISILEKTIDKSYMGIIESYNEKIRKLRLIEERNNSLFIKYYRLEEDLTPDVLIEDITLTINPTYRYSGNTNDNDYRFQGDTLTELLSYSLGCMMGRYSLDREGLVYAYSANEGFKELVAEGAYQTFPADDDGIVPLASEDWLFGDDATARFREFVKTVWSDENLQENLEFVAESLCLHALKPVKGESANDTVRRYFSKQFYKDHCKTYKKRPIYWLFSSGKEKAFECLVYLHRYNEGTLARMRTEYVTPLMGKYDQQQSMLSEQIIEASNTEKRQIEKDLKSLEKKQAELRTFDEQLKHYAEMRITLDLDDGVKANYGKFGNLLADVKAIHGKAVK